MPTTTYRTEDFLEAAGVLGVDVVCASEQPSTFESLAPANLLTLDFRDPAAAAEAVARFDQGHRIDAVVAVDDLTAVAGAAIAARLGLKASSVAAVAAARDKRQTRERLADAGVPQPAFRTLDLGGDLEAAARAAPYPCVLKPLTLSASRGVIRADDPAAFAAAARRIAAILDAAEVTGAARDVLLVEDYVPGGEVALEGLLEGGTLHTLALFDKPDPLEGPFFEETIYVTPSRLPEAVQRRVAAVTGEACAALGLTEGAVHAELRVNDAGPWVLEVAARSIGGLCARTLRFGTGMSLEEILLRHALGWPIASLARERRPAGVMMLPIPRAGRLRAVHGREAAAAIEGVEEVAITAHLEQALVPLPEGWQYLGFVFARADTPEAVEAALRRAHACLRFEID